MDDLLYVAADKNGVVSCLDAKTGASLWQQRLEGDNVASPVYADGRLYFFNRDGAGFVLATGREAKLLARNELSEGCMASPAIAGRELYVRTKTHLYRIEQAR